MLGFCNYKSNEHMLIEPPLLGWLKRNIPDPRDKERVFVYRHIESGNFVIGLWESCPREKFQDIMNLGWSLQNFTRERAQRLIGKFNGRFMLSDLQKEIRQGHSEGQSVLNDRTLAHRSRRKALRSTKTSILV